MRWKESRLRTQHNEYSSPHRCAGRTSEKKKRGRSPAIAIMATGRELLVNAVHRVAQVVPGGLVVNDEQRGFLPLAVPGWEPDFVTTTKGIVSIGPIVTGYSIEAAAKTALIYINEARPVGGLNGQPTGQWRFADCNRQHVPVAGYGQYKCGRLRTSPLRIFQRYRTEQNICAQRDKFRP